MALTVQFHKQDYATHKDSHQKCFSWNICLGRDRKHKQTQYTVAGKRTEGYFKAAAKQCLTETNL